MISCPNCQQPVEILEQHHGTLFTCPHCNAVYFIDWSGQPESPEAPPPVESFGEVPAAAESDYAPYEAPPEPSFEPVIDPMVNASEEAADSYSEAVPLAVEGESAPPGVEEAPYDFSSTLDEVATPEPIPDMGTSDTADFSDVEGFANADVDVGALTYTVVIDGLDSSQLIQELREAMMDLRFRWDAAALIKNVRGGRLVLSGLGPAKASVLIGRIKYLPIKVTWRQDVLSSH